MSVQVYSSCPSHGALDRQINYPPKISMPKSPGHVNLLHYKANFADLIKTIKFESHH